jgi:hypothetical protein
VIEQSFRIASIYSGEVALWVKSCRDLVKLECPLLPQKLPHQSPISRRNSRRWLHQFAEAAQADFPSPGIYSQLLLLIAGNMRFDRMCGRSMPGSR